MRFRTSLGVDFEKPDGIPGNGNREFLIIDGILFGNAMEIGVPRCFPGKEDNSGKTSQKQSI